MISKTQIQRKTEKKRNPELVRTIMVAKKNNHLKLANKLSGPTRQFLRVNLSELNDIKETSILVPGKILGEGEIKKKITVSALGFSEQAKEKLTKAGCEAKTILKEIESNPTLKGVKII
ncbi:50S ribosomal protein L18e [uncultured archaeon]|nr:50S ribosomal protein L18e [uncultured archaeon]